MSKKLLNVFFFLLFPFFCFSLDVIYQFNFPKGYAGTYVPVIFEEVLDESGSYLKALYATGPDNQSPHTLLMIDDKACYSNFKFHDAYAIKASDLAKYSFEYDEKYNKIVVDDKGLKYKRISTKTKEEGGYEAYASFVLHKIFRNEAKFSNIRVDGGYVLINNAWYRLEMDPWVFDWDQYVSCYLSNDKDLFALEMDGIDGGLFKTTRTGFRTPAFCSTTDLFVLLRGLFNYVKNPEKKPDTFFDVTEVSSLNNGKIFSSPNGMANPQNGERRELSFYYLCDLTSFPSNDVRQVFAYPYASRSLGSYKKEKVLHVVAVKEITSNRNDKLSYTYWYKIKQEKISGWIYAGYSFEPLLDFSKISYERFGGNPLPVLNVSGTLLFYKNAEIHESPDMASPVLDMVKTSDESIKYSAVTLWTEPYEINKDVFVQERWVKIEYNGVIGWVFGSQTDLGAGGPKYKGIPNLYDCMNDQ